MLKYKDFKKTINSLNFEFENTKNEYKIVIDNNIKKKEADQWCKISFKRQVMILTLIP